MKALLWLLALAALAVGLTVASRYSSGYVLVVVPPYRAELSVNLLVLLVIGGYLLFYLVTRFLAIGVTDAGAGARVPREAPPGTRTQSAE